MRVKRSLPLRNEVGTKTVARCVGTKPAGLGCQIRSVNNWRIGQLSLNLVTLRKLDRCARVLLEIVWLGDTASEARLQCGNPECFEECQSLFTLELLTRGTVQMYKTYRTVGKTFRRRFMPMAPVRFTD